MRISSIASGTASRNHCRHFRCLSFAGVPLEGQGLPRDAHARYVERSMPRHSSSGLHFCLWLGLIAAACMAARAQERGTGAANANEKEFEALLKQGFELHQQARFAEALPVLERARKLEPQ